MVYNINDGRYSTSQVEEAFGREVDVVNIGEFNEGKGPDYQYWDSITHPETGESLSATRGYVGRDDGKCYYAEYQNEQGRYFNYTRGMRGESIGKQQSDDANARTESIRRAEARNQYSGMMRENQISSTSENGVGRESARRNYAEMMSGNGWGRSSSIASSSNSESNNNGRHR